MRFRLIVLPQIVRAALPALVNEMTLIIKVSPAVAVIGVIETTRAAVRIGAATYKPIPPFLVALAVYVVVIGAFVATQRMLERRRRVEALGMIPRGIAVLWEQRDAMLSGLLATIGITHRRRDMRRASRSCFCSRC